LDDPNRRLGRIADEKDCQFVEIRLQHDATRPVGVPHDVGHVRQPDAGFSKQTPAGDLAVAGLEPMPPAKQQVRDEQDTDQRVRRQRRPQKNITQPAGWQEPPHHETKQAAKG
jgi:hypothetical protein